MCFGAEEFSGNGTLVATKPVVSDLPPGETVQVFHFPENNYIYVVNRNGIWIVNNSDNTLNKSFVFHTVAELAAYPGVVELSTYAAPVNAQSGDEDDADEDVDEPFTNMSTEEFARINAEIFKDAGIANTSRDVNLVMAATAAVINRIQDVVPLLGSLLSLDSMRDTSPVSVSSAIVELILIALEENKTNELKAAAMEAVAQLNASRVPASSYGN